MSSTPIMVWNPASRLDPLYEPEDAPEIPVNLQGQSAAVPILYPRGMILGEVLAVPGLFSQYNPAAADGTQNAKMILRYASSVLGASGAAGAISAWGEWPGVTRKEVPGFMAGTFDLSMLVGLDAAALTAMAGSVREGALGVNQVVRFAGTATGGTWGVTVPAITVGTTVYPAVVIANTALAFNISTANLVIAINNALFAAGIPAFVSSASTGPLGTGNIDVTFKGAYSGISFAAPTVDNTNATGGTVTSARQTNGVAPYGVVRFG